MTQLYEDDLGLGQAQTDSTLFVPPSSSAPGIDLQQAPAPVREGIALAPIGRRERQQNLRQEAVSKMGGVEKFLSALGEFGAGVQGKPSPLDAQIKQQREERALQSQELKTNILLMKETVAESMKLDGETRKKYIDAMAPQLEQNQPGMGAALRTFADSPGMLGKLKDIIPKLPPHLQDLARVDRAAFIKFMGSEKGLKIWHEAYTNVELETATKKVRTILMGYQQIASPEISDKITKREYMLQSEFNAIQDALPDSHPTKLTDVQREAVNKSETFFQSMGIMSSKEEAGVREARAKDQNKIRKSESTIGKINDDLAEGRITPEQATAAIRKATEKTPSDGDRRLTPTVVSVGGKNVAALVDKHGNYFDANTRMAITSGIAPTVTEADERRNRELTGRQEAVVNLENDVNKLDNIIKKHPRSVAGLFSPVARTVEYVSGSLNPEGKGETPGTTALQLRDSILQRSGKLTRMTNADRERLENAMQVGTGGNPRNLPLAIKILKDNIKREKAELSAGRARPKAGGTKDYSGMSDEELLKALSGG